MKYRLEKIKDLSGSKASVYTIRFDGEVVSLFETFLLKHENSFKDELNNILQRLITIGTKTGARAHYFKNWEGRPGDGVAALYDSPNKKLRLYCIRFSNAIVILGSGGEKNVRTLQENEQLKAANYFLRQLSKEITNRIKSQDIRYINDYLDFEGDLEFDNHEDA